MAGPGTPKRPLLVGGAGLIGCNMLVLMANVPGCERVRVLDMRPPSPVVLSEGGVPAEKVEFIQHRLGVDSIEALTEALQGVDCVFSMVTPHVQRGTAEDFHRTNVEGARRLVEACVVAGVPRLVLLSSIAASNHLVHSVNQNEEVPFPPIETYQSAYDLTKRKGEELVLAANGRGVLATCALRPGGVLLAPTDFMFSNLFIVPGFVCIPKMAARVDSVDGRDVCRGMLLAAQALGAKKEGVAGQAFWLSKGEAMDIRGMGRTCAKYLNWCLIEVPAFIISLTIYFFWLQYLCKKALGMSVPGFPPHLFIQVSLVEQTFDISKAQRILGYQPKVPLDEGARRICDLYVKEHGDGQLQKRVIQASLLAVLAVVVALILRLLTAKP